MHRLYDRADKLSREVIGAAIEVHRHKGPGLIESIYERCILRELELRSIPATTQRLVRVEYKGLVFDEPLRFDILVDDCLLAEVKAVEVLHPSSKAQLFSYMKLLDVPIGLLINFHEGVLKNGTSRMIFPGANGAEGSEVTIFHSRTKRNKKETKITKGLNFSPVTILVHFVTFCKNLFLRRAGVSPEQKETKKTKFFQIRATLFLLSVSEKTFQKQSVPS